MYRKTPRIRKVGVAALVAATALSGLVFAPPAGAAPITEANLTLDALSQPSIGLSKANQPAGNLRVNSTLTATDTLTSGDAILLAVDDNDAGANCSVAGDTIAYSAVPTVSVTGTATVTATLEESATCLLLAGAAVNDVLRLTVTGSGTMTAITISGVTYTTGAGAATGPVAVNGSFDSVNPGAAVAFGDADTPDASNAIVRSSLVTANSPGKGAAQQAGGSYAISPIVITEQTPTGADGDLCIVFDDDIETVPAPAPTVAVSGGSDTAALVVNTAPANADTIVLNVTASAPTSTSTFTISGIRLETDETGVQSFTLYDGTCGGTALSSLTNAGFVGDVERFGGSDRFATAQILFETMFGCSADNVIIARADQYPDALAASYLAGASGTGILLTNTNSVPAATLNALRSEGVDNVYLMGGTQAISTAVENQLDNRQAYDDCGGPALTNAFGTPVTLNVERIGGVDRYETAKLISEYPGLSNAGSADVNGDTDCGETAKTAIVTSGENFPDALAAGPLAYSGDNQCSGGELPLLLTRTAAVPSSTLGALGDLGIVNVIVVGGTAAVSDAAAAQLTAAGYNVRRIAGVNRQATAVALATAMINEWNYDDDDVNIARGDDFADALTGGPFSGSEGDVIVLTGSPTNLSTETSSMLSNWFSLFGDDVDDFDIFGGTAAVSAAVVQAALDAASQQ